MMEYEKMINLTLKKINYKVKYYTGHHLFFFRSQNNIFFNKIKII